MIYYTIFNTFSIETIHDLYCWKNNREIFGRTTGIEPANGGSTIHCLDPLGYVRPFP